MVHANFMAACVIEPIKFYIAGIGIFDFFCLCDLDLDSMTFIYELDSYSLKIYRMCKYELPTSRLSKVIVRQTDRQTDTTEVYTTPFRGWSMRKVLIYKHSIAARR